MNRMIAQVVCCALFVALSAPVASAQPQAPIEWGEARLLMAAPEDSGGWRPVAQGDTIVLLGQCQDTAYHQWYATVCVSGNNGLSWSPWHVLGDLGQAFHDSWAEAVFTSQAILCCTETQDAACGFYCTTDLGMTWQRPQATRYFLHRPVVRHDTVFGALFHDSVTWTGDEGRSFAAAREVGFDSGAGIVDVAVSATSLHAVTVRGRGPYSNQCIGYARGPLYAGPFDPVQHLNENILWTTDAYVTFGEDGTGMILSQVRYYPPAPTLGAILVNISHDDGRSWSAADTLTPFQSADYIGQGVEHCGHLWFVYWWDTTRAPGFTRGGARYAFSANNGRCWYPSAQVEDDPWDYGGISCADVSPSRVRLYVSCDWWQGEWGDYYLQWEGQIMSDSLSPLILPLAWPADTVTEGDTLAWAAQASDNDTLSEVRVRICSDVDSCWTVLLLFAGADSFRTVWVVPGEGLHRYRFEAEDFWENVSTYPDSGWLSFVAEPRSNVNDPFILRPSSFILSVFPNPVNSVAVIELQLPSFGAEAQIELFDVLGRRVRQNTVRNVSGSTRLFLDVTSWPSGLYFLKASCGTQQVHEKLLVLK
jgi:hypothetical protein